MYRGEAGDSPRKMDGVIFYSPGDKLLFKDFKWRVTGSALLFKTISLTTMKMMLA